MGYNPPPGWPIPPPGWSPYEGWQPDPSWGPAPPGWNLWIADDSEEGDAPKRSRPSIRRIWSVIGGIAAFAAAIVTVLAYIHPSNTSPQSAPPAAGSPAVGALAVSKVWPFVMGCEGQRVAMPVGKGSIEDFHAGSDTVKDLIANGGGSWEYGQLAIDLSAAPSKSVAIQRIVPHIDRRDVAPPAWIYSPNFGCGPNSADRHIVWKLDSPQDDFRDAGVASGAGGPSNGVAPTEQFGPDFVLSNNEHARIRVDTYACRGNYQWHLDIEYTETGRSGVQTVPVGPYWSYGLADNTMDYHAGWDSSGHSAITSQKVLTGAAADVDSQRDCAPAVTSSIISSPTTSQQPDGAKALLSKWVGHGRSMQLQADGSGTLTIYSGASDGEVWVVAWTAQGNDQALITLKTKTSKTGAGVGLRDGQQYLAALQSPPPDSQVLHFVELGQSVDDPSQGFFFCTPERQGQPNSPCGA
jgi:hypothetical protein